MLKLNHFLLKTKSFNFIQWEAYSSAISKLIACRKTKRGDIFSKFIANKDKNKKWHFQILQNAPNAKSVFEKVHRPHRRQNVLDSLFIKNITDVLSTGDVAPEILGLGIEITGVKVSPCCKVLNVYWQIPPDNFRIHEDIAKMLAVCAPRLRAELISRNVMGKVPHIFFVRDLTNERVASFENALRDADFGPENEKSIIPDDAFTKNMFSFKSPKVLSDSEESSEQKSDIAKSTNKCNSLPKRPSNMKCDVFGINHDAIMQKVISLRSKSKYTQQSAVVSTEHFPNEDLFDKIPGTPIQIGEDRAHLLKQFQVQREMMKKRKMNMKLSAEDCIIDDADPDEQFEEHSPTDEDYIEEDTPDSHFH